MLFSVTTQFQGTAWCSCNAFVWRGDEKVGISDIDGTITRSDVRGMILPKIGNSPHSFSPMTYLYHCLIQVLLIGPRGRSQNSFLRYPLMSNNNTIQ